jgi:hypothetical protein
MYRISGGLSGGRSSDCCGLVAGVGVGIDVPFSARVWLVFVFSNPWLSLVLGLGLVVVFGWAGERAGRNVSER